MDSSISMLGARYLVGRTMLYQPVPWYIRMGWVRVDVSHTLYIHWLNTQLHKALITMHSEFKFVILLYVHVQ